MLPFDSLEQEFVPIPGIGALPKYVSLTLNEHLAAEQLVGDRMTELTATPLGVLLATDHLNAVLAAIILVSRVGRDWTLERVQALDAEVRGAIARFALDERRRWQDPQPKPEATPTQQQPKPMDWGGVFWRLQAAYPNDGRFTAERFGDTPLTVIEGAIAALSQRQLEAAHTAAIPVAIAAAYILKSKGVKKAEIEWFDPFLVQMRRAEARATIPAAAARTFLRLAKAGQVPSWVVAQLDVEAIRFAAEG